MNKPKHTPAPWKVRANRTQGDEGFTKYQIYEEGFSSSPEVLSANRRLIEAAPELLACLKSALVALQEPEIYKRLAETEQGRFGFIELLKDAVRRAEGGSNE